MKALTFLVAGAGLVAAYFWFPRCKDDDELRERIRVEADKGPGAVIKFADLTDFDWDHVHLFCPYTPARSIDEALGFYWRCAERTGIESSDGIALLVFVKDGAVVRHVELGRRHLDFAGVAARLGPLTPGQAVFEVQADTGGRLYAKHKRGDG